MILNWYYLKFTRLSLDYCYLKSKKRLAMENKIETQLHLLVENLLIKELDGKLQICEAGDVFNSLVKMVWRLPQLLYKFIKILKMVDL